MLCPSCRSSTVFFDSTRGEFICTRCGLVILDRTLESGPEKYTRPGEGEPRADQSSGVDFSLHDFGMGTEFFVPDNLTPSERARLRRMRFLHKTSRTRRWSDKSLRDRMIETGKLCESLSLSKGLKSEICSFLRKLQKSRLILGRDSRIVCAALTFLVLRSRGLPRTEREVVLAVARRHGLPEARVRKNLRRTVKLLARELKLGPKRISALEYAERFAHDFHLSNLEISEVHFLARRISNSFKHKSPRLLAAALIYLVGRGRRNLTLREVSEVMGVGLASLSLTVKAIRRELG